MLRKDLSRTYKDHKVSEITISPLVYHTQTRLNNSATYARTGDNLAFTLSDLTNGVKPENVSKVVDENGEPLVVKRDGKLVYVNNEGQEKSATDNRGTFDGNNPDIYYQQAAHAPKNAIAEWFKKTKASIRDFLMSSTEARNNAQNKAKPDYSFRHNEEGEKRYREAKAGVQKPSLRVRINRLGHKIADSFKGDFSNLNPWELLPAKEEFRLMKRRISAAQKKAMATFDENLGKLDKDGLDLFGRARLLDDLMWRIENTPDASLPFEFTEETLKKEHARFHEFLKENPEVQKAIEAEEKINQELCAEFTRYAKDLGYNVDGVFKNPHYYRHMVLDFADAAGTTHNNSNGGFNLKLGNINDPVKAKMREILHRDYMKRYKGSDRDISTNYVQANYEVRSQMAADIEVMKTMAKIRKTYDKMPGLKKYLQEVIIHLR